MRRLSIVDVAGGHQPITNEDGTLWIVFNGEIYNHLALREPLIARGHRYVTHSDTETIIHLYEEYGADCVRHLRGMFAFAIWNRATKTLFIAPRPAGHQAPVLPIDAGTAAVRIGNQSGAGAWRDRPEFNRARCPSIWPLDICRERKVSTPEFAS